MALTNRQKCIFAHFELGQIPFWFHMHALVVSKQRFVHVFQLHGTRSHLQTICVFLFHCFHLYHLAVLHLHVHTLQSESTCKTVQGIRVFHLSHKGIIPTFKATRPVRLDCGVIFLPTSCVGTLLRGMYTCYELRFRCKCRAKRVQDQCPGNAATRR